MSMLNVSTDVVTISNPPDAKVIKVPRIGLGVFQASPEETEAAVACALKEGYRHIDTARLYRNEAAVGKAVRESGIPRDQIFVTTKLWNSDHGYENTLQAFHRSLQELGLEYVDLYLVHSPLRTDARIETWTAMEDILKTGKCRAIGVSNYGIHHLEELLANSNVRPAVNQIEVHPFNTRQRLVEYCQSRGITVQAYSPLAKGTKLSNPSLVEVASRLQRTPAQVLIRWGIQKGFIVLPKSVSPSRIASNAQVYDFKISSYDMMKLDMLNENLVTGWDPTVAP